MKKIRVLFVVAACALLVGSAADAAVDLTSWSFPSTWTAGSSVTFNANFINATYVSGTPTLVASATDNKASVSPLSGANAYGGSGFSLSFSESSNPGHTLEGNFVLTMQAAQNLNAGTFQITYQAEYSGIGPSVNYWKYSLNGGTTWSALTTVSGIGTTWGPESVTFSGLTLSSGSTVEFMNSFTNSATGAAAANFDNIDISEVPEPITLAFPLFGLIFIGGTAGRYYVGRWQAKA